MGRVPGQSACGSIALYSGIEQSSTSSASPLASVSAAGTCSRWQAALATLKRRALTALSPICICARL